MTSTTTSTNKVGLQLYELNNTEELVTLAMRYLYHAINYTATNTGARQLLVFALIEMASSYKVVFTYEMFWAIPAADR